VLRTSEKQRVLGVLQEQLRRLTAQSVLFGDAVAKRAGLNGSDLECLDFVHLRKDATAGELARETGLTTGAITGVIDRLEKAGYVHREGERNSVG
jgi:DNA-binding MarR family transcriptional regulator